MTQLLTRKRVVLAKIETTYGTDPTPTGAANAILVRDTLTITPLEADYAERNIIRSWLGNSERLPAGIRVKVDMEVEMAGSGAAGTAPPWDPLMRACGHSATTVASTSVTYRPISAAFESTTLYVNLDGVLHKITGARGTMSLAMELKQIPTLKFSFTGIYNAPTDTALPTGTYTGWQRPLPMTATNTTPFTLHGVSPGLSALSLDMGGNIVHRELVGQSQSVLITDRKPVGSVTIEADNVSFKDWWATIRNTTLATLAITHGTVAGNKVQVTGSNVQLSEPAYSDMDGVQMLTMAMTLTPSSSGNDEYSLVVT